MSFPNGAKRSRSHLAKSPPQNILHDEKGFCDCAPKIYGNADLFRRISFKKVHKSEDILPSITGLKEAIFEYFRLDTKSIHFVEKHGPLFRQWSISLCVYTSIKSLEGFGHYYNDEKSNWRTRIDGSLSLLALPTHKRPINETWECV